MRLVFSTALLALAIAFAAWRGGGPERSFAAILAAMFGLDRIGHLALGEAGQSIEQMHAVLDLAALGAMAAVMLAARRLWPIWACSLQLLSAVAHWARPLGERVPEVAVRILATAPFLLICFTVIVAVLAHQHRLRRRGFDPSWRRWSRPPTT